MAVFALIMATQLNRAAWIGAIIGAMIGAFIGSSVGIAAAGTATSGFWLFAILGFIIGGFSGNAMHSADQSRRTRDSDP